MEGSKDSEIRRLYQHDQICDIKSLKPWRNALPFENGSSNFMAKWYHIWLMHWRNNYMGPFRKTWKLSTMTLTCVRKNHTSGFHNFFVLQVSSWSGLFMDQRISSPVTIHLETAFIIHSRKLTCPLKRDELSIGNTSSNHWFSGDIRSNSGICQYLWLRGTWYIVLQILATVHMWCTVTTTSDHWIFSHTCFDSPSGTSTPHIPDSLVNTSPADAKVRSMKKAATLVVFRVFRGGKIIPSYVGIFE